MLPAHKITSTLALLAIVWSFGTVSAIGHRYAWGDYLSNPNALGPDGRKYPDDLVNRLHAEGRFDPLKGIRRGRDIRHTMDPEAVSNALREAYEEANSKGHSEMLRPQGRSMPQFTPDDGEENLVKMRTSVKSSSSSVSSSSTSSSSGCPKGPPARLCPTKYNTTAPMYGVSLTSGQPVTIVQKFPDLLQQVIFEVCESDTCDIIHGECVQTYVPYLFLVIPLGPVTLTGQDYVLVESGCVCQPKYSQASSLPSPIEAISG